jgi:hypothetical protein
MKAQKAFKMSRIAQPTAQALISDVNHQQHCCEQRNSAKWLFLQNFHKSPYTTETEHTLIHK